jgi:hypothetical protein
LWIANNRRTFVINLHQDFTTSTHSDSFQESADRGFIYWLNYSWKTQVSNQEEEYKLKCIKTGLGVTASCIIPLWILLTLALCSIYVGTEISMPVVGKGIFAMAKFPA